MIKIAFCDDDLSILNELQVLTDRYCTERSQKIEHTAFSSPLDLLAEIEKGVSFDILFLDIIMPGETGIDAAAEIRRFDTNVKIIFLTSSTEYAVQSYVVGAYYYQLKPILAESFCCLMDSVLSAYETESSHSIILRCKNGITRVEFRHLEYCEVIHRTLFIHLHTGNVLECSGSLDDLAHQLAPYGNFLRSHRSYLVNLDFITNISYRAITLSDRTDLPIPRGKYQEIKDSFLEYAFRNRQVML